MSNAGAQAHKFYEEVAKNNVVWAAKNIEEDFFLEFDLSDGSVSIPLWSSKSRIQRIIRMNSDMLDGMVPFQISWPEFLKTHVPMLKKQDRKIGVNLSGKNITGYDRDIDGVIESVDSYANLD